MGDGGFGMDEYTDGISWREIRHYVEAPLRRPLSALFPAVVVFLLSVVALFVLPKKYESSTLILVESEKVPETFVSRVATENLSQRLWAVKPEILSRTRLEKVLKETQPYPELKSQARGVNALRSSTFVNVSGSEGFTLSFIHRDPYKAQEVANRIATLFIEETVREREEQVGGAVDFLEAQVAEARSRLEEKDEALRRFKETRMGTLPGQLEANLATMSVLQREIRSVDESLFLARERRERLARDLRQVRYDTGPGGPATGTSELTELRRELASLRARRYTDEHPDVESIRARISRLEEDLSRGRPTETEPGGDSQRLADQLEKLDLEIKSLEDKRQDLERRLARVRANVDETPRTEQQLTTLTRDYEELNDNYRSLLARQLEAQMAGRLEQRWKGDRFRILDPANVPERPYSPKPWIVLGLGVALGILSGLAMSVVIEFLDRTIKDVEDLQKINPCPVLASIPPCPGLTKRST